MTIWKIVDFKENDLFQENEQNEQISMKSSITVLLSIGQQNDHFQEITCIRFQRSSTIQYDCIK